MNLTSQYRNVPSASAAKQQKPPHIENVTHSKQLREDGEQQKRKLKKLFPALNDDAYSDEPTVFVDQRPLVDELV